MKSEGWGNQNAHPLSVALTNCPKVYSGRCLTWALHPNAQPRIHVHKYINIHAYTQMQRLTMFHLNNSRVKQIAEVCANKNTVVGFVQSHTVDQPAVYTKFVLTLKWKNTYDAFFDVSKSCISLVTRLRTKHFIQLCLDVSHWNLQAALISKNKQRGSKSWVILHCMILNGIWCSEVCGYKPVHSASRRSIPSSNHTC